MNRRGRIEAARECYKDTFLHTGAFDIALDILVVLKVSGLISTPWIWVLAPAWGGFLIRTLVIEIIAAVMKKIEREESGNE